ncbi:MAG: hypothetical protein JWQ09_3795, partial [Segetibacter sp.]|nr:hypothetical protein [Segetibacter sp.]
MEKSAPISNEPTQQVKPGNSLTGQCFSLFFRPFVQTKLTVNEPADEYEQEADAVADKIMRMSDAQSNMFFKPALTHVHRKCAHCEEEENLQRKESNAETSAGETTETYLNSISGGKSLN